MRKHKEAIVKNQVVKYLAYTFECPWCHITVRGNTYDNFLQEKCSLCGNPIDLIFEDEEK
jgi:transcription elongation factor Elf1